MAQQTRPKIILDDRTLLLFEGNMKRIFAMKISRSTFRELQNVILSCANQDKDLANFFFETLMTGQIPASTTNEKQREILEEIMKNFTIPARLAKEVHERGEFINIITSDLVSQEKKVAFLNRIRRIDGEEFLFMSDPQNTLHVLQHFIARLHELKHHPLGKEEVAKYHKEIAFLKEQLGKLED